MLRRLLAFLLALVGALAIGTTSTAATTAASSAALFTYDTLLVERVDGRLVELATNAAAQVSVVRGWSAWPSAEARATSTTSPHSFIATEAAAEAAGWQGKGAYPGVDEWENVTLAKGTRVHAGEPGVSGFFASDSAAASVGHDATALNQGLQIAPRNGAFRPGLTEFELTSDVTVGRSIASANPQFGPGGLEQFYLPNWQDVTCPIVSRLMT